jgi:pyruvate dehydrogenase E2 component (dihydrolipoamide acetyltransferase)
MATEILLPALGENIDSATVTRILVKVGQAINKDEPILELDTEKASVDVPAPSAGTVKEIRVKEGDVLKVGQVVLVLSDLAEAAAPPPAREKKAQKTPAPAAPPPPEPTSSAEPEQGLTIESKKESAAAPPPAVQVAEPPAPEPPAEEEHVETASDGTAKGVPAAPSLRRMARELGIDIGAVMGTGPNGWITKEDVRNHARSIILNATVSGLGHKPSPLPDFSRWGAVERKPMSNIRRTIAEHLQASWTSIPHVTIFASADITELEKFREDGAGKAQSGQPKLTVTAIAVKVVSAALRVFPQFNASLDPEKEEVVYKKYFHIGVAVDTEHGLLVPVIRDVDKKSISELSAELAQVAEKARTRKLSLEDMQGGSFTITNLGGIGVSNFTPIINSPEVAILGISRSTLQPVFRDGEFKPRLMLPLALSFDHRVADGADAARFLRWVVESFEQPLKLVL